MKRTLLVIAVVFLVMAACKKEPVINPFDDPSLKPPPDTTGNIVIDSTSFVGLHNNIFSKTCANSGCHDGSFEPDYRSIESAYNTLVYQPIVKNDPQGTFTYRVLPNNAEMSVLYQRLIMDIDGLSGIMPLEVDPGSDWNEKKDIYIQQIKTWIDNGAVNMFGEDPVKGDRLPQMAGVVAFAGGGSPLDRNPGLGPIKVPSSANNIDIYFAISDPETATNKLTYNKVKISNRVFDYENVTEKSLSIVSPITEDGYFGDPVEYYHHINHDVSQYEQGETIFMRVYVQDATNDITEIPGDGSLDYIILYFAFEME